MLLIRSYETLASTNDEAMRLAREGAPEGTVVWALRQTKGRGRRGRIWESPEGNLHLSVIARPELRSALAGRLAVAAGQFVAAALERDTGLPVRTKWPNDLYLRGRKLGGVLVETSLGADDLLWAVIGVGINVIHAPETAPPAAPSVSLQEEGWRGALEPLAAAVAEAAVNSAYACADDGAWREIVDGWPDRDEASGPLTVLDAGQPWQASGEGLDFDGALLVRTASGRHRVTSEVTVRTIP